MDPPEYRETEGEDAPEYDETPEDKVARAVAREEARRREYLIAKGKLVPREPDYPPPVDSRPPREAEDEHVSYYNSAGPSSAGPAMENVSAVPSKRQALFSNLFHHNNRHKSTPPPPRPHPPEPSYRYEPERRIESNSEDPRWFLQACVEVQATSTEFNKSFPGRFDPNCKDGQGFRGIHMASVWGRTEVLLVLLRKGVDVNPRNNKGHTPLHSAAIWGRCEIASILLNHGAQLMARDYDCKTSLDLARAGVHKDMITLLESRSAGVPQQEDTGEPSMQS